MRLIFVPTGANRPEDPFDRSVLELLDGKLDVGAIAAAVGTTQFDVARALHRLVQAGLARAQAPDRVRSALPVVRGRPRRPTPDG